MVRFACLPVENRRLDGTRLTLPAGCRSSFETDAAVAADVLGCVLVTPPSVWEDTLALLRQQSEYSHHASELFRFFAASETTAPLDNRGRLVIPRLHMQWARLTPDGPVVVASLGYVIQVWNPEELGIQLRTANFRLRMMDVELLREQLSLLGS
jgi:DNA-binding transcriptional regulator/RsmH inhibitor MraZ